MLSVPDLPGSRPIYSIGAVARMVGVPPATLRTWEERYGLVRPERSEGRHRLYSRDQVEQLRFVKAGIDAGANPADAHRLLGERLGEPGVRLSEPRHRLLILLAERDELAAEFTEYFLRTEGYDVQVSLEARQAQEAFERDGPDLAIIEVLISGGAGIDLCRTLKRERGTPVLVMSALRVADEAAEAGADAFLVKPVDPLELVSAVKDLLGESAFLRSGVAGPP